MIPLVKYGGNDYDRANNERGNLLCTCERLADELAEAITEHQLATLGRVTYVLEQRR